MAIATRATWTQRMLGMLPAGYGLPEDAWRQRHRIFVRLLWVHVVGLFVFGVIRGFSVSHSLLEASIVAVFAVLAAAPWRSKTLASVIATFGMMTSSGVLVHLSGGTIEAHFHFFVMMTLIPLYQSWIPFWLAFAYVVIHHGFMGYVDPDSVYNHASAIAQPFKWALIHGAFILGASIAGLIVWKRNEDLRMRVEGLQMIELRQRSARELNDNVVQGLTVAKMASELGDMRLVQRAVEETLAAARAMVGQFLPDAPEPGDFRRTAPVGNGRAAEPAVKPRAN